jgi:hypothetical protein
MDTSGIPAGTNPTLSRYEFETRASGGEMPLPCVELLHCILVGGQQLR